MGFSDPDGVCGLIGPQNWLIAHIHAVERKQALMQKRGAELGAFHLCFFQILDELHIAKTPHSPLKT